MAPIVQLEKACKWSQEVLYGDAITLKPVARWVAMFIVAELIYYSSGRCSEWTQV